MTAPLWPLTTTAQAKTAVLRLQQIFQDNDNDIRTLGHSKVLHRFAEAVGLDNWHQFVNENNRAVFEHTLRQRYGLSEQYTGTAVLSVDLDSDTIDPVEVAENYARRFNISQSKPVYGQDPALTEQAHSWLSDILSDDADTPEIYGAGHLIEVTLIIASGVTLSLSVDPRDRKVSKGVLRCTGFGTLGVAQVAPEDLERIAARYADHIDDIVDDVLSR